MGRHRKRGKRKSYLVPFRLPRSTAIVLGSVEESAGFYDEGGSYSRRSMTSSSESRSYSSSEPSYGRHGHRSSSNNCRACSNVKKMDISTKGIHKLLKHRLKKHHAKNKHHAKKKKRKRARKKKRKAKKRKKAHRRNQAKAEEKEIKLLAQDEVASFIRRTEHGISTNCVILESTPEEAEDVNLPRITKTNQIVKRSTRAVTRGSVAKTARISAAQADLEKVDKVQTIATATGATEVIVYNSGPQSAGKKSEGRGTYQTMQTKRESPRPTIINVPITINERKRSSRSKSSESALAVEIHDTQIPVHVSQHVNRTGFSRGATVKKNRSSVTAASVERKKPMMQNKGTNVELRSIKTAKKRRNKPPKKYKANKQRKVTAKQPSNPSVHRHRRSSSSNPYTEMLQERLQQTEKLNDRLHTEKLKERLHTEKLKERLTSEKLKELSQKVSVHKHTTQLPNKCSCKCHETKKSNVVPTATRPQGTTSRPHLPDTFVSRKAGTKVKNPDHPHHKKHHHHRKHRKREEDGWCSIS